MKQDFCKGKEDIESKKKIALRNDAKDINWQGLMAIKIQINSIIICPLNVIFFSDYHIVYFRLLLDKYCL